MTEQEALKKGMEEKSREFAEKRAKFTRGKNLEGFDDLWRITRNNRLNILWQSIL